MGERGRACACGPRVWHPCAPAALRTPGTRCSHDCTRGGHGASHATRAWKTTRAGPSSSVKTREHEDRDLPARLVLILDKNGHLGGLAVEQALALLPRGHRGLDPKALVAHFDRRLRVREEVVVPGRVLGGAGERGDHDEALDIRGVHQGFRDRPPTAGAGHRQEQHGHLGELSAYLPLMRAEFTHHALIDILQCRHIDLQKMNWKFRAGFQEHTGVSLKDYLPNNPMRRIHPCASGYSSVAPPSKTSTAVCSMPIGVMMCGWCDGPLS